MSSFTDAFTGPTWGSGGKTSKPAAGGKDAASEVDPATKLGRWAWRWRLHLAVLVPAAAWGLARVARAVTDPGPRDWAVYQWQAAAHQVADERWPQPAPIPPDWWHGLAWAGVALLVATVATLAVSAVPSGRWGRLLQREARWRDERRLEHRWEDAMHSLGLTSKRHLGRDRVPRLDQVHTMEWGGFEGRVHIPKGFVATRLIDNADIDGLLRRELDLGGERGTCEQLVWSYPDENSAKYMIVEIVHKGLPKPQSLKPDLRPAPDDNTLRIGVTSRGFAGWDLNTQPALRCSGASGKGKGHWGRWIISQAVQKGWLVVIIDGAGAPEHKVWAGVPNVRYAKLRLKDPDAALVQFAGQMADVCDLADARQQLCDSLDLDDWKSMDEELRKEYPRILVVFDEFTALMGKSLEDDNTKRLRQHLGWMINRMLRLYRKYGVNCAVIDQVTYSGTWIGPDGLAQATQYVWCGMPNRVQQNMLSSGSKFPRVPNKPGYGMIGVAGELEAIPIVWSIFERDDVKQVVASERKKWDLAA